VFYGAVVRSVQGVPGVVSAGLNDYILLQNEDDYEGFVLEGQPLVQASVRREEWRRISPDYFRALGIALLFGRPFSEADNAAAPSVAIVNQAFARKYFSGRDAVGRRILITNKNFRWTEVVGVVGDERTIGVNLPARPMLYVPFHRDPRPLMGLFVRTEADPRAQLRAIQQAVWAVDPTRPVFSTVLLEALVAESISVQRATLWVAAALAGAALALTAIGIFGVMSYTATQRINEFGIRMALGAQPSDLRALVLREGLSAAGAGVLLGAAAAAMLARALSGLLYGVSPADPLTFAAVTVLLLAVALLACWLPVRRAARVDPIAALRHM
jgi:putative ABC transport system permease protein